MATFSHRLGRLVAAFGLVAALALTPASADAGVVRGVHRGRAAHRHHVNRAVRRNVARHAAVRPFIGPRAFGVAAAPIVVQPVAVAPIILDLGW